MINDSHNTLYGDGKELIKFEIDEETGMINELDNSSSMDTIIIPLVGKPAKLEQIFQAVKKTQEQIHTEQSQPKENDLK